MPIKDKDEFGYHRRTVESARKAASEKGGNFDSFIKSDFKKYKVRDGKNLIRIIQPTWDDAEHYAYTIQLNYGIGVDNQSFLSLSAMLGEKDPLAEAKKVAEREGDKKTAKALQPRKRRLMWIIDRLDEEEGPQLFDCPLTVDNDFLNLAQDEDTKEVMWVDDPKTGHDIRFYKEGVQLATKYPAAKMKILGETPLHEDLDVAKDWITYVKENPVPECLNFYDYDHIASVFDGTVRTADDDEDKDEKPSRKPARDEDPDERPSRKPSREPEPDPDEDPEPQPKKPAGRQRSQLQDEEAEPDHKPRRQQPADDNEDPDAEQEADAEAKPRQNVRDRIRAAREGAKRRPADED